MNICSERVRGYLLSDQVGLRQICKQLIVNSNFRQKNEVYMAIKKLNIITEAISEKKGKDISVLNLKGQTVIADYFVIASGGSSSQVKALAENTEEKLAEKGFEPIRKEGVKEGKWAILDYGDIIVHIFEDSLRDYYALDKLWEKGSNIKKIEN